MAQLGAHDESDGAGAAVSDGPEIGPLRKELRRLCHVALHGYQGGGADLRSALDPGHVKGDAVGQQAPRVVLQGVIILQDDEPHLRLADVDIPAAESVVLTISLLAHYFVAAEPQFMKP